MRLLNVTSLDFTDFHEDQLPKYAIASHRWVEGSEVTLEDVRNKRNRDKSGYKKIVDFARYVQEHVPSVEWLWVDTCCINKESAAELSKSLNLMFDWYRSAVVCIAHLADVEVAEDKSAFERSEWFKRGWTLQELLAPRLVLFVTRTWQVIGNKGASTYAGCETYSGPGLERDIASRTGIPERVLHDYVASSSFSFKEKLQWIEGRTTTEPEDMSYALYGIVGVRLGANYGERYEGARQRLEAAIHDRDNKGTEQFQKIVEWLSPANPWTNHQSARQLHEPRTGTWLIQSDRYHEWKAGSMRNLWMHGKAGCGKTILCSTAIEDVKAYCERQPNAGYAFFYFSFSDEQKQRLADLLRSLVVQLGWKEPALSKLQEVFDKPNRSWPGLDELEKILLLCFESYDEVFLLFDALDECPEEKDVRRSMLEYLARLSQKARYVKVFATSRELPDIRVSMVALEAEPMAIATRAVDVDIEQYVTTQILHDYRLSRLDPRTKALITETISTKSEGMFRWAYCQLQELKKLKSTRPKFVKDALYCLPTTLDETYDRMLIAIEDVLRRDALTLLRWLAYAKSPPSLGELVEATIIDLTAEGKVEVEDRPGIEDALGILSGLVTTIRVEANNDLEQKDDLEWERPRSDDNVNGPVSHRQQIDGDTKVRLAHFSVKEYLESRRILDSKAKDFHLELAREHKVLTRSCLIYLMHYSSSDEKTSTKQDFAAFPLLQYAAQSWFHHSALQHAAEVTLETRLLCNKDTLHDWLLVHQADQFGRGPFKRLESIGSGLYYASRIGLEAVVASLLSDGADINAQGGAFGNALQAAAASWRGDEKIVQMLLDAGAHINAQGGKYGNALQAASRQSDEKVVQMLLDAGADINAQGGKYGNALQAASWRSDEKIVQILLDAGAHINAQGGAFGNALQAAAASRRGNEKVVQMLLDAGAHINAQGGDYGNALQAASRQSHEKVVQMLLDAGADINAQGGAFGNALQAASSEGHEKVVQMLLDAGADINAQGGDYGNALQAAAASSWRGNKKIVQMLLDAGADINAQGGEYGNALQTASWRGDEKIVQMLLDAGADINAQGGKYGNALQAAAASSRRGNEKIVQMLLDAGADIDAQGGRCSNALQAASLEGNEKVVQMLLDAGADINAQVGAFGNALYAASAGGYEKVVQMLLDAGAHINAQAGRFGNALQGASLEGHEKVVQILLDRGADINAQGGAFGNALQAAAASRRGNEKIVQMLLDAGADINAQGGKYGNALQAASWRGDDKVVQMLLEARAHTGAEHEIE